MSKAQQFAALLDLSHSSLLHDSYEIVLLLEL
jgi:hypothetical protein